MAGKVNGVVTRRYLWDGQLRIVAELDGSGNLVSQFVYGTKVNVPEYMIKSDGAYRIITDQLGSVRLVVKASTGAVAQRMDYDEFGVVTNDTNPGFTPFGFAGGLYDNDTKLVRFGARDYDAETGRWTSKDPILFAGGDANLFGYILSDPINAVDVLGLKPGDRYRHEDSAAMAASADIWDQYYFDRSYPPADQIDIERGGFICVCEDGFFTYTPMTDGGFGFCDPRGGEKCPPGCEAYAFYHSHPNNTGISGDDRFYGNKIVPLRRGYAVGSNGSVFYYDDVLGIDSAFLGSVNYGK